MKQLAAHYNRHRRAYPDDKLIIVFDIDRTILDLRCHLLYLLQSYDQMHGTQYFKKLSVGDINITKPDIQDFLDTLELPGEVVQSVANWYRQYHYSATSLLESYKPLQGVMELIRWLQLQPQTYIGLNSSRPESLREETLTLLNKLGDTFKVKFEGQLLYLNKQREHLKEVETKNAGIQYFRQQGYRVIAVIDNNPKNIYAISEVIQDNQILMLHTDTVFSPQSRAPFAKGNFYNGQSDSENISRNRHVQFVWHCLIDRFNLEKFLSTNIRWLEVDVRIDWIGDQVIVRSDSFDKVPMHENEQFTRLQEVLKLIQPTEKCIKIDLREGQPLLYKTIEILKAHSLADERLWFNAKIDKIGEEGFKLLRQSFPDAIIQTPVDFIKPLILGMPNQASDIMNDLEQWGINRFSVGWKFASNREFIKALKLKGYDVNIYNVPDFESFLQASLLGPTSITSDFNYSNWEEASLMSGS